MRACVSSTSSGTPLSLCNFLVSASCAGVTHSAPASMPQQTHFTPSGNIGDFRFSRPMGGYTLGGFGAEDDKV